MLVWMTVLKVLVDWITLLALQILEKYSIVMLAYRMVLFVRHVENLIH